MNTGTPEHFNTLTQFFPDALPNVPVYQHTCLRDAVRQANLPIYQPKKKQLNYPSLQTGVEERPLIPGFSPKNQPCSFSPALRKSINDTWIFLNGLIWQD